MYGSTCADMQVDVMGECLSCIVVGVRSVFLAKIARCIALKSHRVAASEKNQSVTTSGCFYPRSNHWEVGYAFCSKHRFTTLETISGTASSSGRPRGTTPADDRYIVLQARRNRRQTAG
ncbi:hypothetical protein TNCV_2970311 [Trichonephila clavipes]|nr:hypothetical protein TNCV_2970311 [Trichonephila clavipes]